MPLQILTKVLAMFFCDYMLPEWIKDQPVFSHVNKAYSLIQPFPSPPPSVLVLLQSSLYR